MKLRAAAADSGFASTPFEEAACAVEQLAVLVARAFACYHSILEERRVEAERHSASSALAALLSKGRAMARATTALVSRVHKVGSHLALGHKVRCTRVVGPGGKAESTHWGGDWVPMNTELTQAEHAVVAWQIAANELRGASRGGRPASGSATNTTSCAGPSARHSSTQPQTQAPRARSASGELDSRATVDGSRAGRRPSFESPGHGGSCCSQADIGGPCLGNQESPERATHDSLSDDIDSGVHGAMGGDRSMLTAESNVSCSYRQAAARGGASCDRSGG